MEQGIATRRSGERLAGPRYWLLVFVAGCLAGWVYEEIFYWITEGMLRNRGVLYGPWLPVYGLGALAIYAMKPVKKWPLLLLLCVGASGVVEYTVGAVCLRLFGLRLWDYRGLFLNLDGLICFRSVVSFGIMGMAFHYLLEPAAGKLYRRIPERLQRGACLGISVLFLGDCVLSFLFRTPITY